MNAFFSIGTFIGDPRPREFKPKPKDPGIRDHIYRYPDGKTTLIVRNYHHSLGERQ